MAVECEPLPSIRRLYRWNEDYFEAWYNGDIDDPVFGRYGLVYKPKDLNRIWAWRVSRSSG